MAKAGEHRLVHCLRCGVEYRQSRSDQLYCSHLCYIISWRIRNIQSYKWKKIKNCLVCGAEFLPLTVNQKHCSAKCTYNKRLTVIHSQYVPKLKSGYIWRSGIQIKPRKKCFECKSEFYTAPSYKKRGDRHGLFCSRRCAMINRFRNEKLVTATKTYTTHRGKSGKRLDLGNQFFRSRWEANYARYLNFLINHNEILKWEYEVDTFEFTKIKRGTRFYTPDFKIVTTKKTIEYHEVKGWMDEKSITRAKRMKKYYPAIKIVLIDGSWFKKNGKILSGIIANWEK